MRTHSVLRSIPESVRSALATFELFVLGEESRQESILREIMELAAAGEPGNAVERLNQQTMIRARSQELRAIDRRIEVVRARLEELREQWPEWNHRPLTLPGMERVEFSLDA